ncbi:LysR family transcriptional regulator [Kiloniella laminariae]|uniref:LysR family transcriptional regulator n=1 Tax=Kiloniella laminariae TaxID=454162 RepID=A0ABT4LL48_9PROT|nr:LysR family transcriptional regulator [Kiloniella laminariae]MCZ4281838.1 LysR family transcriptional regulator [Kiloniella laminariae]
MDLNEMAVFAAVVEYESFTASARALGVSKSAVSKQINRLEDRLGIRLLNRTTRRLSLTEAGAVFFESCQQIISIAQEAEQAVSQLSNTPRGVLKINAPMSFGIKQMGPLLAAFQKTYPEIEIDVVLNDQVVDLVDEGFDVGIRIGSLMDSRLMAKKVADCRMAVVASPTFLPPEEEPTVPAELSGLNYLQYSYLPRKSGLKFSRDEGQVTVQVKGKMTANNGDFILSAVMAGMGIACMPTFICGDLIQQKRLKQLLPQWEIDTDIAIYLVYPVNRNLPPKVRAFIDFVSKHFSGRPVWDKGF